MTSSARLAISLTASIAATAACLSTAGADGIPGGNGIDAAPVAAPGGGVEYLTAGVGRAAWSRPATARAAPCSARPPAKATTRCPRSPASGSASGLSADGRTLVLIEPRKRFPRARTKFAILDAARLCLRRLLSLRGDFSFDALSPDGRRMYLINYLSPRDEALPRSASTTCRQDACSPKPIVDPSEPPDEMTGLPITRDEPGRPLGYTLYDGAEHPFIHALDTMGMRAVCIDLDLGMPRQASAHPLRLHVPPTGSPLRVVAGDRARRTLASVDAQTASPRRAPAG